MVLVAYRHDLCVYHWISVQYSGSPKEPQSDHFDGRIGDAPLRSHQGSVEIAPPDLWQAADRRRLPDFAFQLGVLGARPQLSTTALRLTREPGELSIVADQIGAPTWARNIAHATALIEQRARRERSGGARNSQPDRRRRDQLMRLRGGHSRSLRWVGSGASDRPKIRPITSSQHLGPRQGRRTLGWRANGCANGSGSRSRNGNRPWRFACRMRFWRRHELDRGKILIVDGMN